MSNPCDLIGLNDDQLNARSKAKLIARIRQLENTLKLLHAMLANISE